VSWAALDDNFHSHPKVRKLQRIPFAGAEALGIWAWCLSWCRAYSPVTGRITTEAVADAWNADELHVEEVFELLLRVRLVDEVPIKAGDPVTCYLIHDWPDWQNTGQRKAGLARAASASRVGGRFARNGSSEHKQPSSLDRLVKAGNQPVPTQPSIGVRVGRGEVVGEGPSRENGLSFRERVPEPK
jgi:hypothetical protein